MAKALKRYKHGKVNNYLQMSTIVNGSRKKLNFGGISKQAENRLLTLLEELEDIKATGGIVPPNLRERLSKIDPRHLAQFKRVGLIEERATKTLSELFRHYCDETLKTTLPKTVRGYRSVLKQIANYFGEDCGIDSLSQGDIKRMVADKVAEGKAGSTVKNYLRRGSQAFKHAVQNKWLVENPFDGLAEMKKFSIKMDEQAKRIQQELVQKHIDRLLNCPKSKRSKIEDKEWNALVWLLRWTGCRIAEALVLRWDDIDFDNCEILMRSKSEGNNGNEEKTVRYMPLWPGLVDVWQEEGIRRCRRQRGRCRTRTLVNQRRRNVQKNPTSQLYRSLGAALPRHTSVPYQRA